MNKILTKWQALSAVILGIAFLAILTVFPLRLWYEPIEETSNRIEEGTIELFRKGPVADQMFVAQYDHLDGIDFLVKSASGDAAFVMCVYDENWVEKRKEVQKAEEKGPFLGRVYVPLNLDTKVGKQYYYTLKCTRGEMRVAYEVTETSGFIYNGPSHVGEEALGGCNLITGYRYGQPLRKGKSVLLILAVLAVAVFLTELLRRISRKSGKLEEIVTLQWGVKTIFNPLIIIGTIAGIVAVGPLYLYSYQYVDIAVFVLGVLFLGILLWHAVNRTYERTEDPFKWDHVMDRLPDVLQSFCVAMALLACIHYMNGLYEIFHDIAYREMLIWLALAMIVTFSREELFNLWNAAGIVISAVPALRYYRVNLPEAANEYEVQVLKLTAYLAVLITLVAIHTIFVLVHRRVRVRGINLFYCAATGIVAGGMIYMRNERWWPVMMVVAFGLFGIHYAAWDKKDRFLNNLLNGILYNFVGCTIFCLLHRPYMSFGYTRYPQMFHTVTVTATYLAVVMSAAMVKLLYKYNQEKSWKACFFEIVMFGTVSCYVLFTMSRTGMIGVVAMGIATWIFALDGNVGERAGKLLRSAGMMALAVLFFFPVCFTCQRIIPAIVNQPVEYDEIEHFSYKVLVGEDRRSDDYITMDRFVEIFADKMLGLPEDTIVLYHYRIGNDPVMEQGNGNRRPMPMPYFDEGQEVDFTNGRIDIYKSYYEQLTMEGHEEMGAVLENGTLAVHAHNIYLQFAFDHGIIMGIVFIVWMMITAVYAWLYYHRNKEKNPAAALPLSVTVLFAVAGVVEWIAHPCNPAGFVFLMILLPLLFDDPNRRKENHERKKKATI